MEKTIIRARAPQVLGIVGLCVFSIVGLAVAHPGADPRLASRLTAGGVISVMLWLLWQLGIETRIVLDNGEIAVYYPFLVRRVGSAHVTWVSVEKGDLTICTAVGKRIKPPAYRVSVLGALRGNRGSRAVQHEIEQYIAYDGSRSGSELRTFLNLRLWVLIDSLAIFWARHSLQDKIRAGGPVANS